MAPKGFDQRIRACGEVVVVLHPAGIVEGMPVGAQDRFIGGIVEARDVFLANGIEGKGRTNTYNIYICIIYHVSCIIYLIRKIYIYAY